MSPQVRKWPRSYLNWSLGRPWSTIRPLSTPTPETLATAATPSSPWLVPAHLFAMQSASQYDPFRSQRGKLSNFPPLFPLSFCPFFFLCLFSFVLFSFFSSSSFWHKLWKEPKKNFLTPLFFLVAALQPPGAVATAKEVPRVSRIPPVMGCCTHPYPFDARERERETSRDWKTAKQSTKKQYRDKPIFFLTGARFEFSLLRWFCGLLLLSVGEKKRGAGGRSFV